MPWLPIYADDKDIALILSILNDDCDVAFIVSDGPKNWKAVARLDHLIDGRYCLWIHSSGPLPLLKPNGAPDAVVPDPWLGWTELRTGANPTQPYFGPGDPNVVWFNVKTVGKGGAIGMSGFEWIGNHYRIVGKPASETAEKWWQRLGRRIKKIARRIPREGPIDRNVAEIWVCPSALSRIISGTKRDANP